MIINWDHYPEIFLKTKIFPSPLKEKSNSSKTEERLISPNFCQNLNKKLLGRNKLKVIIFFPWVIRTGRKNKTNANKNPNSD